MKRIMDRLEELSAVRACASVKEDLQAIWYRVANPWVRELHSFEEFKQMRPLETWFQEFDIHVCMLLSQPLFETAMKCGDASAALHYIAMGARYEVADLDTIQRLGADLNCQIRSRFADSCTLLHVAAFYGHSDVLPYLIRNRLCINAKDNFGYTPLHCVARSGHVDVAKILLDSRAAVHATVNGCTPLHRASYAGHVGIVKMLLSFNANLEAVDSDMWTPITCAVKRDHRGVVYAMLDHGLSELGLKHALGIAMSHQRNAIVEIISSSSEVQGNSATQ